MEGENKMVCGCKHHKIVPICITLIGLVIFLGAINILTAGFVGIIWPVLLIIIGVMKMMKCKCC